MKNTINKNARIAFYSTPEESRTSPVIPAAPQKRIPRNNLELKIESSILYAASNHSQAIFNTIENGSLEDVRRLVNEDRNILNCRNTSDTYTPLHFAASLGKANMIRYLLEAGANSEKSVMFSGTPLHLAVELGHLSVVTALLEGAVNVDCFNNYLQTPLHIACFKCNYEMVELLAPRVDFRNNELYNQSLLIQPLDTGRYDIIKLLAQKGFHCYSNDYRFGGNLLHLACETGRLRWLLFLVKEMGLSLEEKNKNGQTPLQIAIAHSNFRLIDELVSLGANVNVWNEHGLSPLMLGVVNRNRLLVLCLLKNGASPFLKCLNQKSPYEYAMLKRDVEYRDILAGLKPFE